MLTAYGREEAIHAAKNITVEAVLAKPITPQTLQTVLLKALGNDIPTKSFNDSTAKSTQSAINKLQYPGLKSSVIAHIDPVVVTFDPKSLHRDIAAGKNIRQS